MTAGRLERPLYYRADGAAKMRSRIGANRTAWAAVFLLACGAGLFLYLWAALRAPVVVWSDSRIDLALARERLGFLGGAAYRDTGGWGHAVKPGYVFFLTLCTALFRDPARASVVVQSVLLFSAIAGIAFFAAKRRSAAHGAAFLLLAIAMLSFRDAASAVMSEALATAGFLALAAWAALGRRVGIGRALLAGTAVAALFLVRPNVGAAAGVLLLLGFHGGRLRRPVVAAAVAAGFLAVAVPVALARRAHAPEPGRSGMSSAILTGSLDYLWPTSAGKWPSAATPKETAKEELRLAASRWRTMWPPSTPGIRRQWIWRAFHGLLGTDFYDASWSKTYWRIDEASKVARPFVVLLCVTWVLCALRRPETRAWGWLGTAVLAMLVAQNLLVGSLPRYGLPFLAPLLLLAVLSVSKRFIAPLLLAGILAALVSLRPGILDREWGRIEKSGVVVTQEVPKNELDRQRRELHVRIGALTGPTTAELSITDDSGRRLFDSRENPHPDQPVVVVPLPADLLERNRRGAVALRFVAGPGFDETNFYVFPVVPRPWAAPARREGSAVLSPATGVVTGSFEWW